ncbi:hypothetical protein RRG08_033607 [Elysia crispata]|uniref:Uncharacterized protein n=1 Tax=Elysia crispata TaxID=231223 RepID=A0AAE1CKF5_9GAST|nr:hypothetical protein RRG08_033607 [Elysia crispata]
MSTILSSSSLTFHDMVDTDHKLVRGGKGGNKAGNISMLEPAQVFIFKSDQLMLVRSFYLDPANSQFYNVLSSSSSTFHDIVDPHHKPVEGGQQHWSVQSPLDQDGLASLPFIVPNQLIHRD